MAIITATITITQATTPIEDMHMTDLHSHILPGIDDGAKDQNVSASLLQAQLSSGVTQVACTPHFYFERQTIEEFCQKRDAAKQVLFHYCAAELENITVQVGAEVLFSPGLLELDLKPLCMENTSLMLVELPTSYYPLWTCDVLYRLGGLGVVPLIAHVERYPYVMENPNLLLDWISAGAYTQVNATSLVQHKKRKERILKMIRHRLIHVIATDTHSLVKRPPLMGQALTLIEKNCGTQIAQEMCTCADALFAGEAPEQPEATAMKQLFGHVF